LSYEGISRKRTYMIPRQGLNVKESGGPFFMLL
jgi:hypothetical protein